MLVSLWCPRGVSGCSFRLDGADTLDVSIGHPLDTVAPVCGAAATLCSAWESCRAGLCGLTQNAVDAPISVVDAYIDLSGWRADRVLGALNPASHRGRGLSTADPLWRVTHATRACFRYTSAAGFMMGSLACGRVGPSAWFFAGPPPRAARRQSGACATCSAKRRFYQHLDRHDGHKAGYGRTGKYHASRFYCPLRAYRRASGRAGDCHAHSWRHGNGGVVRR